MTDTELKDLIIEPGDTSGPASEKVIQLHNHVIEYLRSKLEAPSKPKPKPKPKRKRSRSKA